MTQEQLFATAPTLDAMRDCVTRFYAGESKTLIPDGTGWKIVCTASGATVAGVHVVKRRNRYRFETCPTAQCKAPASAPMSFREELTAEGVQLVIPGCERVPMPDRHGATQLSLF